MQLRFNSVPGLLKAGISLLLGAPRVFRGEVILILNSLVGP